MREEGRTSPFPPGRRRRLDAWAVVWIARLPPDRNLGGRAHGDTRAAAVAAGRIHHRPPRRQANRTRDGTVLGADTAERQAGLQVDRSNRRPGSGTLEGPLGAIPLVVGHDCGTGEDQATSLSRTGEERSEEQGPPTDAPPAHRFAPGGVRSSSPTWHWVQLRRSGCVVRRPGSPATPWQLLQSSRIHTECGIDGGAPGAARTVGRSGANPAKAFAGSSGFGNLGSVVTWHCVQLA